AGGGDGGGDGDGEGVGVGSRAPFLLLDPVAAALEEEPTSSPFPFLDFLNGFFMVVGG
ncbi:hypothetical protein A2U01_0069659, partial [Trifolium medium]|nr:hypothetical protein [Trifolium medium]